MKKKEWNEGLNHLDPDLVEKYVEQKESLRQKSKKSMGVWLRFGAIAACFTLILSAVIVVPMLREDDPGVIPEPNTAGNTIENPGVVSGSDTTDNTIINPPTTNDQIQGSLSYNDGITISDALSQAISKSSENELISVVLEAIDMVDVYASTYADRLYDGQTYDEWWAEYEVYTNRMIEIEALLKREPNAELEKEFNLIAEKAENLAEYMSKIQKEQKAESVASEITWLKSQGIEANYKKGYFVFTATPNEIKNISKGKCDYYIDIESHTQEPVEEMH